MANVESWKRGTERIGLVDCLSCGQGDGAPRANDCPELVAKCDHLQNLRFYKGLPYAFTEHGAIQAEREPLLDADER